MKINLTSIYNIIFFRESALPSLTNQQKKILAVASIAIGLLVACYLMCRCCLKSYVFTEFEKKTYPDGTEEEGEFWDDKLNGQGKRTRPDRTVEQGEFFDDELHGKGKKTYPDGSVEEGEFDNDSLKKGKRNDSSGIIEVGKFRGHKLHGKGKKTYPDGKVEEGDFKDDELNGQGKRTYKKVVEEGEFKDGHLIDGKRTDPAIGCHSRVEEGEFKEDQLDGQGKIIQEDCELDLVSIKEGKFRQGKLIQGKNTIMRIERNLLGKSTWCRDTATVYDGDFNQEEELCKGKVTHFLREQTQTEEGEFKQGELHGQGKVTWKSGEVWEGKFINGHFQEGKLIFPNGLVIEGIYTATRNFFGGIVIENFSLDGNYIEGKRFRAWNAHYHDKFLGKITFSNGIVEKGEFEFYKLNGKGKRTYSDGSVEEGKFQNDNLIEGKKTNPDGEVEER